MNIRKTHIRTKFVLAAALLLAGVCQIRWATIEQAANTRANAAKTMKLVAEYKKNHLEDISSDGRLVLLYQTSTPVRTFTFPLQGGKGKANQPEVYDDVLRVVERNSGREIARTAAGFYPFHEQFIPGTNQVFYSEPKPQETRSVYKVWDLASGRTQTCLDSPEQAFSKVMFFNGREALAIGARKPGDLTGDLLFGLSLPECKLTTIGAVDPRSPEARIRGGAARSPDAQRLAYLAGDRVDDRVLVWDVRGQRLVARLSSVPLFFGHEMAYAPDGNLLIVSADAKPLGTSNESYILFYETKTYQLIRRQRVLGYTTAIAVSPDSQTLAVAYTDRKVAGSLFSSDTEQAIIKLYDISTGNEVAAVAYPRVRRDHSNPSIAEINRLIFTPDGKHLLSSTQDTRVWEIQ